MSDPFMSADIAGRVRNVTLPASRPLLPLYEAVVNSIQSIEDVKEPNGKIEIVILRDKAQGLITDDRSLAEIVGFRVTDNGEGFTEANFRSFWTSDSKYKFARGGKGIGRFLWLAAFESAEIDSVHLETDKETRKERLVRTRFAFAESSNQPIAREVPTDTIEARTTTVELRGFREKYRKQCPKKLDTIASLIVEHCLEYFIRADCPQIVLSDTADGSELNLNDLFTSEMQAKQEITEFTVANQKLFALHLRLTTAHAREHTIHFCARDRVVRSEKLLGKLPDLSKRLQDASGNDFAYACYVEGELLNKSLNTEGTAFAIAEDDSELFGKDITWKDIRAAAFEQCSHYLAPFTQPIQTTKRARIERFCETDAPMYRPILKHVSDAVGMIDPDVSDDQLDLQLYRAYHDLQVRLKAEGQELVNSANDADEYNDYLKHLETYFEKVTDINASDLARYVCHRRTVLDLLQKQLSIRDTDGKYKKEERVHRIVFPMVKTSADIPFESHNLWLLDERLSFHMFLASDKQLRTHDPIATTSKKEPDIVVYNSVSSAAFDAYDKAVAFTDSNEPPFSSIVIVEFKKPGRENYSDTDNPFAQVVEYIDIFKNGKAKRPDGTQIPLPEKFPFYCYIVCDMSDALERQAKYFEMTKMPDGQGFFGWKRDYNAYVEVVSYAKLVSDAKKRNKVFFEKLGIPSGVR